MFLKFPSGNSLKFLCFVCYFIEFMKKLVSLFIIVRNKRCHGKK